MVSKHNVVAVEPWLNGSAADLETNADHAAAPIMDMQTVPLSRLHLTQKHAYLSTANVSSKNAEIEVDSKSALLAVRVSFGIVIIGSNYTILMASSYQLE